MCVYAEEPYIYIYIYMGVWGKPTSVGGGRTYIWVSGGTLHMGYAGELYIWVCGEETLLLGVRGIYMWVWGKPILGEWGNLTSGCVYIWVCGGNLTPGSVWELYM